MNRPASRPAEGLRVPPEVKCARDYERLAEAALEPGLLAHVAGGAGEEQTLGLNRSAFKRHTIIPRILARAEAGHTRLVLSDGERQHPFFLAPVAHQGQLRAGGDIEAARGAAAAQAGLVLSTLSSITLEEVAAVAGPDRWFQLYAQPDPAVTRDLVRRAEASGYRAIVLTVDAPVQSPSLRALRAGFSLGEAPANLATYPQPPVRQLGSGDSRILQGLMADAPGWADLEALVAQTSLPVWVKGVMHPDDAAACVARGAAGVVVSNHGGRALDGAPSTLSVLPRVRAAVGATPVLVDGGIRSGSDAFKAIALGADGVLVGRLQAYALAVAGALGVAHLVKLLREELELCMALAGCATLADVRKAEVLGPEGARPC